MEALKEKSQTNVFHATGVTSSSFSSRRGGDFLLGACTVKHSMVLLSDVCPPTGNSRSSWKLHTCKILQLEQSQVWQNVKKQRLSGQEASSIYISLPLLFLHSRLHVEQEQRNNIKQGRSQSSLPVNNATRTRRIVVADVSTNTKQSQEEQHLSKVCAQLKKP